MASQTSGDIEARLKTAGLRNSPDEFLHQVAVGKLSAVSLFLAAGMAPDTKNEAGESAISIAAKHNYVDIVEELHRAGASLEPLVHCISTHTTDSKLANRLVTLAPLGTLVSGLVIAIVGWHFTNSYNKAQLETQKLQREQNDKRAVDDIEVRVMSMVSPLFVNLREPGKRGNDAQRIVLAAAEYLTDYHKRISLANMAAKIQEANPAVPEAVASRMQEATSPGESSALWFTVLVSLPIEDRQKAEIVANQKLDEAHRLGIEGQIKLCRTKISNSYAIVIGEKLPREQAMALASHVRNSTLASDAFAQKDRGWTLVGLAPFK